VVDQPFLFDMLLPDQERGTSFPMQPVSQASIQNQMAFSMSQSAVFVPQNIMQMNGLSNQYTSQRMSTNNVDNSASDTTKYGSDPMFSHPLPQHHLRYFFFQVPFTFFLFCDIFA
jgi:hypothetical protein